MSKLFTAASRMLAMMNNDVEGAWVLPNTGGVGTAVLTVVGIILIGLALILFVVQRKRD